MDVSNLHRQTLFSTDDVGTPKLDAAVRRLAAINPEVTLEPHAGRLNVQNADALISQYDVVVDGSDTFTTRYLVNDASVATGTPNVYASVGQFSGQASVFGVENGPCYRCLFPEPPPAGLVPNCEDGGVLGVVPSLFGTIQATEALKLLLSIGDPLVGRLLLLDALAMEAREITFARDPACPGCGPDARRMDVATAPEVSVADLRDLLTRDASLVLLDVRSESEHAEFDIGGRLIPLGHLGDRTQELSDVGDRRVVVYCTSGGRSAQAVRLLRDHGIDAASLRGGLDAWQATGPS